MKLPTSIALLFLSFVKENPNPEKLYIATNIDGTFDIIQFIAGKDSLIHILAKKAPGIEYDFFGEQNLSLYRKDFKFRKLGKVFKYETKNDSIFFDTGDGLIDIDNRGKFKKDILYVNCTYIYMKSPVKKQMQTFRPY